MASGILILVNDKLILVGITGLLQFSRSTFPAFLLESGRFSSIFVIERILFSSTKVKVIPADRGQYNANKAGETNASFGRPCENLGEF